MKLSGFRRSPNTITVYTERTENPRHVGEQDSRRVVGMKTKEQIGSRVLWLAARSAGVRKERLTLPDGMAARLREFYINHKINDPKGLSYSCDTLAGFITTGEKMTPEEAHAAAGQVIANGQPSADHPEAGQWGVYGTTVDGRAIPLHSVVSLDPKRGEVLQIDQQGGDLRIASTQANDAFFAPAVLHTQQK